MKRLAALVATFSMLAGAPALAQDAVADFYRGKQVQLRIGFPPGSGYDLAGRIVSRHIGKYIPGNPSVIVQNIAGAGSLLLANQMFNVAPRDGTVIGLVSNAVAATPLFSPAAAQFDPRKFNWVGSNAPEIDIVILRSDAEAKNIADLFSKETVVGASGLGGAIYDLPYVMNALMGTKFKIVSGYQGTAQIGLAIERGEVQGLSGIGWTSIKSNNLQAVRDGRLKIIAQFGLEKHPDLPEVPLFDLPKNEVDREALELMYARMKYGRPMLLPPDVPQDRVAAIRKAFLAAMKDADLVAEAEKVELEINPLTGEQLGELTQEVMKTKPAAVARLREILEPDAKK